LGGANEQMNKTLQRLWEVTAHAYSHYRGSSSQNVVYISREKEPYTPVLKIKNHIPLLPKLGATTQFPKDATPTHTHTSSSNPPNQWRKHYYALDFYILGSASLNSQALHR
jgi:hypothetical protein